jgi:hypothetical protein
VNEQHADVGIATFGDPPQAVAEAGRILAWGQAEVAGEMASRRKAAQVAHEAGQRRGHDQSNAGDLQQTLHGRQLLGQGRELVLDHFDAALDLAHLRADLGEERAQRHDQLGVGVFDAGHRRQHFLGAQRDEEALLALQAAQGVERAVRSRTRSHLERIRASIGS